MLIDIHTHNLRAEFSGQLRFVIGRHSLGIHPWELIKPLDETLWRNKFVKLKDQFNKKILAIGECGLDRRRAGIVDIFLQEKVLSWHIDWAQEVNRPLIIHCVHAESDLLKIFKERNYQGKVLVHDFSGNLKAAEHLLKYNCYFSFGKKLFNINSKAAMLLNLLPRDKIFLETDDQTDYLLEDLYQKAKTVLSLEQKECENLFTQNLLTFFSDLDNVSPADVVNDLRSSVIS